MIRPLIVKHHLTLHVLPIVLLLVAVKWLVHGNEWDTMELNTYFSTLVAVDMFLLGFLVSAAMPDYKEAEKIPGEMACALDSIVEECAVLRRKPGAESAADACLAHTQAVINVVTRWFHHKEKTRDVISTLIAYSPLFARLEPHTTANFLVRLKQEVSAVRRMVIRMRNIREASVILPAYAISEMFTGIVLFSMLFVNMGTMGESLLIMGAITYLLLYMIVLIRDLDNPFQYHDKAHMQDEIAIEPLGAVDRTIRGLLATK